MKTILFRIVFIGILVLASFIRVYRLTSFPPSLFADEVDAGYQALVFNHYQSDYFGNRFPVHFHSFSDWRTSLYIYSISILTAFNFSPEIAVRLPSAIFGILSLPIFYLIIKFTSKRPYLALISMTLLSLSPWHIHYSRTGFEVSGMLFCLLLGIYYFLIFQKTKKSLLLFLSVFFLILSPYFYSTAKLFVIIIAILIILIYRQSITLIPRSLLIKIIFFSLLISLPLINDTIQGKAGFRFSYINIFTKPNISKTVDYLRYEDIFTSHSGEIGVATPLSSKIVHNRIGEITSTFLNNYLSSFSTSFLFQQGDSNPRHGFGRHGLFYLIDFILIPLGIFFAFRRQPQQLSYLFLYILILSPLPFSLTRDSSSAHATRLFLMLPSLIYFSTYGIYGLFNKFFTNSKYIDICLKSIFVIIYLFSFYLFWHYYTNHYPQDSARSWHTGMKQAVITSQNYNYQSFYFSDSTEPFLPFFLFYNQYLPPTLPISSHIQHHNTTFFDGSTIDQKFYFGRINWGNVLQNIDTLDQSLFIVPQSELIEIERYLSNKIFIKSKINKLYINQEEFLIFSLTP